MSPAWFVFAWLLLMQTQTDEDLVAAAKAAKAQDVRAAQDVVDEVNDRLKAAMKTKDSGKVKALRSQVRDASLELTRTRNKSVDEYVERERQAIDERHAQATEERKRREQRKRQANELDKKREEKRKVGPLSIDSAVVAPNEIGITELNFTITNNTNETIDAFDLEAECLNGFDEPLNSIRGSNLFSAACVTPVRPGGHAVMSVQMSLHNGTAKALVRVTRAKMSSGDVWTQSIEEARATPGAIVTALRPRRP